MNEGNPLGGALVVESHRRRRRLATMQPSLGGSGVGFGAPMPDGPLGAQWGGGAACGMTSVGAGGAAAGGAAAGSGSV